MNVKNQRLFAAVARKSICFGNASTKRETNVRRISLSFLGGFEITDSSGQQLSLPTLKDRALLAYLTLNNGRFVTRATLATLLWGDRQPQQARRSLRQALHSIRALNRTHPVGLIETSGDRVRANASAFSVDTLNFRQLADSTALGDHREASALCKGELLQGMDLKEDKFNEWLTTERAQFDNEAITFLEHFIQSACQSGHAGDAIQYAQSLLSLDFLREESHQTLMRLYRDAGRFSDALRQYRQCKELLDRELGEPPSVATEALRQDILERQRTAKFVAVRTTMGTDRKSLPTLVISQFEFFNREGAVRTIARALPMEIANALIRSKMIRVVDETAGPAIQTIPNFARTGPNGAYQLTGHVRRSGRGVRVTISFKELYGNRVLWGDRYNRQTSHDGSSFDELIRRISGNLELQVIYAEGQRLRDAAEYLLDAEQCVYRGFSHMNALTPEDIATALRLFRKGVSLDPHLASAHACVAWCYRRDAQLRGVALSARDQEKARHHAKRALELEPSDPFVLFHAAEVKAWFENDLQGAIALMERSLAINPNSTRAWTSGAELFGMAGRPTDAIENGHRAIEISPLDPSMWVPHGALAVASVQLQKYDEAVEWARRSIAYNPFNWQAHWLLAASLAQSGELTDAEEVMQRALVANPHCRLSTFADLFPIGQYENLDCYFEGLRSAGMPL